MGKGDVIKGVREVKLNSWEQYSDIIRDDFKNRPAYIFRGQAHSDWSVLSSLDRLENQHQLVETGEWDTSHLDLGVETTPRHVHLKAFQQASVGKRGPISEESRDIEWWALGQHHGLATPLLDFTLSPFVALFFAFEEEKIPLSNKFRKPDRRAVFALSANCIAKKSTDDKPSPKPFLPMVELSPRMPVQSGVLLEMPERCELTKYVQDNFDQENEGGTHSPHRILIKYIIPNQGRVDCLKFLNKMNISRLTLFPDLDGTAQYINAMWELDFDTALGWIPD